MKIIAIVLCFLVGCIDDPDVDTTPASCAAHVTPPTPYGGLIGGPCQLVVTVDMACPTDADPTLNQLIVLWWVDRPAPNSEIIETTYTCGERTTIKFGSATCTGNPIMAVAGFQDPITGAFNDSTADARTCTDQVVAP